MTAEAPLCPITLAGTTGRMGHALLDATRHAHGCKLVGALGRANSSAIGQDAGAVVGWDSGVRVTADIAAGLQGARCLIDFTRPETTLEYLAACGERQVAMVIGTTGFDDAQKAAIAETAKTIPIVLAPNMSVGVNVTFKLLEMAAKALSTGYDIEIIEAHHRHKVDAPSGTALKMGEVIAAALGRNLQDCAMYGRSGHTGERDPSTIGFSSIRGGDIVGDHTVLFAGTGERIEISHKSGSRAGYAEGALRAAEFAVRQPAGLYDMFDVLGLR